MISRLTAVRKFALLVFAFSLGMLNIAPIAQAGMISTPDLLAQEFEMSSDSDQDPAATKQTLIDGLVSMGVDPADAYQRVDGLTEQELAYASERLEDLPAGGSAIYVIGVVFLVLLILELVGVTNVFNRI